MGDVALTWQGGATLALVGVMSAALVKGIGPPDLILLGTLAALVAIGALDPGAAAVGFGNPGLVAVGLLFVVVAGLTQTGAMQMISGRLLGSPRRVLTAQARLMFPVAVMSGFLNNTPLVAAFLPVVGDWSRRLGHSASRLYLPLSYASILGGTCTMLGTSTNLVVGGLVLADLAAPGPGGAPAGLHGLGFFEPAWVGLPAAVVGLGYCLVMGRWLLPDRKPAMTLDDQARRYTTRMRVLEGGPLVGKSIESAGLRRLPGLYLHEVQRGEELLPAVGPQQTLLGGDVLVFAGLVESVVDLRKVRGLAAASDQSGKLAGAAMHRTLIEAVVSDRNAMLGRSIREGRFRSIYDAAVIAVSRGGETIQKRIGDIVLEAGDVLLLEATPDFVKRNRNRRDFFLVSGVEGSAPTRHERAWLAITLLVGLVALATFSPMGMMGAALVVAAAMVVTRCCTGREARQAVDWSVLLVIGSALGVAAAMEQTGAAAFVAHGLIAVAGDRPMAVLAAVYLATMLFTGFITNNAAAVLMYPIAAAAAGEAGVSFMPFVLAIMFAASNDFATPIGYQTNLMVYGPGGYRFTDYLRFGGPLNLLMFAVFMAIAPWVWPL